MEGAPLTTALEADLAPKIEENIYEFARALVNALDGEIEASERMLRYYTWPGSPMFKGVFRARLAPEEVDATIEDTVAWFKARQAPFFFWWTGADTQPANLRERLLAHGFQAFDENSPAMAADIEALHWDNPRPAALRLDPVMNEQQLVQWKDVFLEAFQIPAFAGQAWVDAHQAVGSERAPWKLLLGTLNGEPVCCGLLFCGAGVAGLIGLGTRPAFRRQGIGSAMQLERLRLARELGYRYAVLFASEMGYSPYLKLGFKDTGRRIHRYLWVNPARE